MLNALPDSRRKSEMNSEVFLTHHERFHDSVEPMDLKKNRTQVGQHNNHWPGNQFESVPTQEKQIEIPLVRFSWKHLLAECVAELLGTAILVLVGCASVAQYVLSRGERSLFLSVDFAFGFGAMIGVYVAGPVSGNSHILMVHQISRKNDR